MTCKINADTTDGLKLISDTSGEVDIQDNGTTRVTIGDNVDIHGNELILDADGDTSITADTDDQIDFKIGGTDRMVIDSSGVDVTGTVVSDGLTVDGTANIDGGGSGSILVNIEDSSLCPTMTFTRNGGGTITNGFLKFENSGGQVAEVNATGGGYFLGNLLVGTTSTFDNVSFLKGQFLGGVSTKIAGTAATTQVSFFNNNGRVGYIGTSGTTTSYNTSSDYRLKENVNYTFDATTRLKQLKPARFNFITDPDTTVDGFIAHEVSSIVPEAITGTQDAVETWQEGEELPDGVSVGDNKLDDDGNTIPNYQGIDQSKLVPLLVKTIQELEARITALESE